LGLVYYSSVFDRISLLFLLFDRISLWFRLFGYLILLFYVEFILEKINEIIYYHTQSLPRLVSYQK